MDTAYDVGPPHQRQRAARGAGDQGERCCEGSAMHAARRVQDRGGSSLSRSSQTEDAKEGPKAFEEKRSRRSWQRHE